MTLQVALVAVSGISIIGNRILSLLVGLLLRIPAIWLLPTLYLSDLIQIPFYYWIYENSSALLRRFPARVRAWFEGDASESSVGRWTSSLGGAGVFLVSTLPIFGGGIWSAVFIAHGLKLRKTWSYFLVSLGSLVSFICLYWILDTLVRTYRYFCPQ